MEVWHEIEIEFSGRKIRGCWTVTAKGLLLVRSAYDQKSSPVGDSPPPMLAEKLLRELAAVGNA
jgi:hypothetical protein